MMMITPNIVPVRFALARHLHNSLGRGPFFLLLDQLKTIAATSFDRSICAK